jgi:hypothetical protein
MSDTTCSIEGCVRPARRKAAGICEAHYYRIRRTGSPGTTPIMERRGNCTVAECVRVADGGNGYCQKHYTRLKRHGDPEAFIAPQDRNLPKGETSHWWSGDDVTYSGMHQRLRTFRGSASNHVCVDCGGRASQWSYDRRDPNEKQSEFGPFSASLGHYVARCVPCHKAFDLAAVRS